MNQNLLAVWAGTNEKPPPQYHQIPNHTPFTDSDSELSQPPQQRTRKSRRLSIIINAVTFVAIIILTVAVVILSYRLHALSKSAHIPVPISCSCGSSIAEARALGCKYDTLAVSWLPPQCRDDELTEEFDHSGPGIDGTWQFFADGNGTKVISAAEVALMAELPIQEAQFFTTVGWHLAHCSFYWRKEFRMRNRGFRIEGRYDRESHIKHCHMMFVGREPLDKLNTKAVVGLNGDWIGAVKKGNDKHHEHLV